MHCSNCHAALEATNYFCKKCGKPVNAENAPSLAQPAPQPVLVTTAAEAPDARLRPADDPIKQPVFSEKKRRAVVPKTQTHTPADEGVMCVAPLPVKKHKKSRHAPGSLAYEMAKQQAAAIRQEKQGKPLASSLLLVAGVVICVAVVSAWRLLRHSDAAALDVADSPPQVFVPEQEPVALSEQVSEPMLSTAVPLTPIVQTERVDTPSIEKQKPKRKLSEEEAYLRQIRRQLQNR